MGCVLRYSHDQRMHKYGVLVGESKESLSLASTSTLPPLVLYGLRPCGCQAMAPHLLDHVYSHAAVLSLTSRAINATAENTTLVGWTSGPNGRGTLSLLWSCLSTTFLCTWVVIHPRIHTRRLHRTLHKIALSLKTVIAPECIAAESVQEWLQARRILRRCAQYTKGQFSITHAFYLGMFGVRYRLPLKRQGRTCTKVLWPMQYAFLLEKGYIRWDDRTVWGLDEDTINDKSNADSAAKLIATWGVLVFTANSFQRLYHRLPLAPLESMTLGYIPLFVVSYYFWWQKPKDIEVPTIVELPDMSSADREEFNALGPTNDFDDEGKPGQQSCMSVLALTPRDFDGDVYTNPAIDTGHSRRGEGTVLSHWDPELRDHRLWPLACLFGISFGALHLASWENVFPTTAELWLWRGTTIASMTATLVFMQFQKVVLRWNDPVTIASIVSAGVYIASRFIAIVEAFASLRASQPAIYRT